MGHNDHLDYEASDLTDVLSFMIDMGMLEGVQLGIARQIIEHGSDSLSPSQTNVLESIKHNHFVEECSRCGMEVPLCEMIGAFDSGMCGYCDHMTNKDD